MPAPPSASADEIRDVNTRYHDGAAAGYDAKWGIDYGEVGQDQVLGKVRKALGASGRLPTFPRSLEIGAGTGYFTLNLLRAGVIDDAVAMDISPGMLRALDATAKRLDMNVRTIAGDAESLPFAGGSFDLVLGHAVLHHLPDLDRAMAECARVLAPGGTMAFMGEPSRHGDRLAAAPKRFGAIAEPAWRRVMRATPKSNGSSAEPHAEETYGALEGLVDVHTFTPGDLTALARRAGFTGVRVCGEELVANMYGWFLRRLESNVEPDTVPHGWHVFAFRSYLALQGLDGRLLEPRLPASLFYNLMVSGRKP